MKSRKIIFIQKIFYLIKINLHKKNISIIVLKKNIKYTCTFVSDLQVLGFSVL